MLPEINTTRIVMWALVIAMLTTPTASAEPIRDGLAGEAYALAERWVSRGAVPESTLAMPADDVVAVHATLRFDGVTLGQRTEAVEAPLAARAADKPTDIGPLLVKAIGGALDEARKTAVQIASEPGGRRMPTDLAQLAPLLVLDLQFAGPPTRIQVQSASDLPDAFVIDLHGLAMARDEKWAWLFAGTAIAGNVSLRGQLARLLADLKYPPEQVLKVGQADGPPLYRFACVHLVRPRAGAPLTELYRGKTITAGQPASQRQVQNFADRWADHLLGRVDEQGRFRGTYHPTADRNEPALAGATDAALASFALSRYARLEHVDEQRRQRIADTARRALGAAAVDAGFAATEPGAAPPNTALAAAADAATLLIGLLETPGMADEKELRDRCAAALIAAQKGGGGFRVRPHAQAGDASRPVTALICYALVRMYDQTREPDYLDAARRGLVALWRDTDATRAASAMPWALLAELNLLERGKASPGLLIARRACDEIWKSQVPAPTHAAPIDPAADDYTPRDTVGGFGLDSQLVPEPTWQSAGMLTALGAALPIESFVGANQRARWVVDGTTGLAFLHQLTMTDEAMWYVHNPTRALGGVRAAMWDNRQPLPATAMALLAAAQWQHSLQAIAGGP